MREDKVFEAAMRIAEGVFRFTTEALEKFGGRREVNITVKTVTAGIRGTDLWGKSTSDGQIVCLIAGTIEVTSPGERPFTMDRPLSFYALEGELSRAIATVPPDRFREWAAETETQPGGGVSRRGGKWKIAIATGKYDDTMKIYDEVRKARYPAQIVPCQAREKRLDRGRLAKFETRRGAGIGAGGLKPPGGLGG